MGRDMTLREFVDSVWFRGLARGAMLIVVPALVAVGGMLIAVLNDQYNVRTTLAVRAADSERFQAFVTTTVSDLEAGLDAVKLDTGAMKLDLAMVKGILMELQRRDVALTGDQ